MFKNLTSYIRSKLGLWRSILIYYWKPFNESRLKQFYGQFIQEDDLCFDVGAHLGNRSNAWLKLGAKVVAIEPQPQCIRFLEKKFGRKANFTLVKKGVGTTEGSAELHISAYTPTVTTLANQEWRKVIDEDTSFKVQWEEKKTIDITTLDQLIEQYGLPAFCKLDIENYEYEALLGLSKPIPCLSVEFYPATIQQAVKCVERLEQITTYKYNWSFGESQKLEHSKWVDANTIITFFQTVKRGDKYGDFYARIES